MSARRKTLHVHVQRGARRKTQDAAPFEFASPTKYAVGAVVVLPGGQRVRVESIEPSKTVPGAWFTTVRPTKDAGEEFSSAQLAELKSKYAGIKTVDPSQPSYGKLTEMLGRMSQPQLKQLALAGIPFVSSLARNRMTKDADERMFKVRAHYTMPDGTHKDEIRNVLAASQEAAERQAKAFFEQRLHRTNVVITRDAGPNEEEIRANQREAFGFIPSRPGQSSTARFQRPSGAGREEMMPTGSGRSIPKSKINPVTRALLKGRDARDKTNITSPEQARATGASLVDYLDTTREVRQWCQAEGVNRAYEAYVVEGWKRQRNIQGLSENV